MTRSAESDDIATARFMPRLRPSLFWRARRSSPGAALLLPVCRDLSSALTELRWIQAHVDGPDTKTADAGRSRRRTTKGQQKVLALCRRRGRGEPLQYVLGTQPFGPLDLLCRRGVLIPRPEPEAYSMHLADLLLQERARESSHGALQAPLTILDACTGTGCIALLLYARLRQRAEAARRAPVRVVGVDLVPAAVSLARANAVRNGLASGHEGSSTVSSGSVSSVRFVQGDLFADDDWLHEPAVQSLLQQTDGAQPPRLDVLVSNPPYVSTDGFARDTARSVRLFEPKLAQVPDVVRASLDHHGQPYRDATAAAAEDVFYVRLLDLATRLDARILLCETGGLEQAERVVALALAKASAKASPSLLEVEIWADQPDIVDVDDPDRSVTVTGRTVAIKGSGHGRSVFIRRR
ncbi:mitochondrial n-glutamine methyltransferase mtq1 [Sporothrix brasiliensis 5110]|uniref:Mitochondrial n-glutamine methyltransferase mtq1 n=1 Tax=Sporothrix brasiliensis 5110 TaxID=1398154 RepID=A0A0C2J183_9PEZI|nr:mitochondrial n-glutamine methyltransferase mtq1 [Sporothrix brasiliensis 5110]KIH95101.1 mitochondrial n-glutamine methyltransferase mtq1 [Sporothrix brasiliensis 5110]